ncbi:putative transport protein [hydrocarbon metagenome]|uniref:Putative transport protein n=1 Tax=hydrocarbon metagenome TaxID=938273 RepID=A0A0W8FF52_9ZZZZ
MTERNLSPPIILLLAGASLVIILAGIRAAAPVLGPLLLAVFIAMLIIPIFRWLIGKGLPTPLALGVLIAGLAIAFLLLSTFVTVAFGQLMNALPAYQEQFRVQFAVIEEFLAEYGIDIGSIRPLDLIDRGTILHYLTNLVVSLTSAAFYLILVVIATGFLLLEAPRFSTGIERWLGNNSPMLGRLRRSGSLLVEYMIVRTKVNLVTGSGAAAVLYLLGVDFALFWGLVIFVLAYIPYLGITIGIIPVVILTWLTVGPAAVAIVLLVVTVVNTFAELVLFPHWAGHGLNLSPFIVLFSVFFWGFILGAVGVFLAVPLTLAVKLLLENWNETYWLAAMMSSDKEQ